MGFWNRVGGWFANVGKGVQRGLGKLFDLDTGIVSRAMNLNKVGSTIGGTVQTIKDKGFSVDGIRAAAELPVRAFSSAVEAANDFTQKVAPGIEGAIDFTQKIAANPVVKALAPVLSTEIESVASMAKGGLNDVQNVLSTAQQGGLQGYVNTVKNELERSDNGAKTLDNKVVISP